MSTDIWDQDELPVQQPVVKSAFKPIADKVAEMQTLAERIEKGEKLLKELKEQHRKIEQEQIPDMLMEAGVSEIKVDGYGKVSYSLEFRASVKSGQDAAFKAWANEHGFGEQYKEQIVVTNPGSDAVEALDSANVLYDLKNATHAQTLKKIARLHHEAGGTFPECMNVFQFNKTKVKK